MTSGERAVKEQYGVICKQSIDNWLLKGVAQFDGIVKTSFIKNSVDRAHSVVIDNDGKIIVAGETENEYTTFGLVRLIGK